MVCCCFARRVHASGFLPAKYKLHVLWVRAFPSGDTGSDDGYVCKIAEAFRGRIAVGQMIRYMMT